MKLIRLESTDSTNTRAFQYLNRFDSVLVIADTQTAGRGRGDNSWESPRGNIYLSVGKKLDVRFLAGLSVRVAIHIISKLNPLLSGEKLQLKWPNDLYRQGRKAGGILVESKISAGIAAVVSGIGLNLSTPPLETAAAVAELSTLPREETEQVLAEAILAAFRDTDRVSQLKKLVEFSWFRAGDRVRFTEGLSTVNAVFDGYSEKLEMMVRTENGRRAVLASEVSRVRKFSH